MAVRCSVSIAALVLFSHVALAQISFGPNGTGVLTFDTLPPASQWSSQSVPPANASGVQTPAQLDDLVQTNAADTITSPLTNSAGVVPPARGTASWSPNGYVQTRATGNSATLLMATLRNESGIEQTDLRISYDFRFVAPTTEQLPGYQVYFSLTGATGTWQRVSGLGATNEPSQVALLPLGSWSTNALLYLLWADDNGSGVPDTALQIDNVLVVPAAPTIPRPLIDRSVAPGGDVTLTIFVNGEPPFFFQWLKNGDAIPAATNQSFTIGNAQAADEAFYSVIVSNAFGSLTSGSAFVAVACSELVSIVVPSQDQFLAHGRRFSLSASVSGTDPISLQWLRNGVPIPGATSATYTVESAVAADSGNYVLVASNCLGVRSVSGGSVGIAYPPETLITLTNHAWRYDQNGNDLGTVWRATNYDDSVWPTGLGIFGFEDNAIIAPLIHTPLSLDRSNGAAIITYYFRTLATLTNLPGDVTLVASNYFDDGAIIYVNEVEALRYNLPSGTVAYGTLAPISNPAGEGVFIVSNLSSALFRQGQNFVAVELHQSQFSADVAFGMELSAVPLPPRPLNFTNGPADVVAEEGESVTLAPSDPGQGERLQWFKDGAPVPGATALTLTFTPVTRADAGYYVLRASNAFGVVFSRMAHVTVLHDTAGPELVRADWSGGRISASFSEPVDRLTATNLANYSVTNTRGGNVTIYSASLTNQTNVLFAIVGWDLTNNFVLTARNISDARPSHNVTPASAVPVAMVRSVVGFDSAWDFYDPNPPFDDPDPGPNWRELEFTPVGWSNGPGAFGYMEPGATPPVPISTALAPTVTTSYFRRPLWLSFSAAGLSLNLRYSFDDGAALYLNNQDLFRYNMPAGMLTPQTKPSYPIYTSRLATNINVPVAVLLPGSNLLAVEVHQAAPADNDKYFDKYFALEVTARVESLLTGPMLLLGGPADVTVLEREPVGFRISAVAVRDFQWQMNGTNLSGATNPTLAFATTTVALDGTRFRCLVSDGTNWLASSNATLRVVADVTRPALISAIAMSNVIVVSFSEALAPETATNLSNYVVTNSSGAAVTLSGAVLQNGTNVVLLLAEPLEEPHTIAVTGVTDTALVPNAIAPDSAAVVGFDIILPMDSTWRYLVINTNSEIQASFAAPGFDDSAWPEGKALLFNEDAPLPAPKNTLLPVTDTNGHRIPVFYFRHRFFAPTTGTNVTLRLRHIIDDGVVLHLNGQEIFRANVPLTAAVANATLIGPIFRNVSNLAAGTNILAAEVHQYDTTPGDIVFGVEMTLQVPSVVLPLPPAPRLGLVLFGSQFALQWDEPGYTLECAGQVIGPWTALSASSPTFVPRTNAAAFYRLRK